MSIYLLNYIGQKIVAGLRERLWKKVLILPVSYYDQNRTGDTISRMTNDTGVVKTLISEHLSNLLTGGISIIGSLIVLFVLDWKMTILLLTVIPLSVLILVPLGRKMYKISKALQDETASFTSVLTQVLSEIRLVKSSNTEKKNMKQVIQVSKIIAIWFERRKSASINFTCYVVCFNGIACYYRRVWWNASF